MKRITKPAILPLLIVFILVIFYVAFQRTWTTPEFIFTDLRGETISANDLSDHPWYLEFWSVDCSQCVADFPKLIALNHQLQERGGQVIAVAAQRDSLERVEKLAHPLMAVDIRVVHDETGEVAQAMGHPGLTPYGILMQPGNRVDQVYVGPMALPDIVWRLRLAQ